MRGIVVGSLVAAVAMFFWGFLFWAVTKAPYQPMKQVADVPAFQQALRNALPETGVYLVPHPNQGSEEELGKMIAGGAFGRIVFVREGAAMGGAVFGFGFLHYLVTALLLGLLLRTAALPSYGARVVLCAIAGLAGAFFSSLTTPIWYMYPTAPYLVDFAYVCLSFVVAGLVLARFVKPS